MGIRAERAERLDGKNKKGLKWAEKSKPATDQESQALVPQKEDSDKELRRS